MDGARRFAAKTSVPVERSKSEIEQILTRYGADGFFSGWDHQTHLAILGFRHKGRQIRMQLPLPKAADYRGSARAIEQTVAQDTRQRWRALVLVVKAKLEAVQSKVSTFEQEFMPYIVMPDGRTVGEIALPQIAIAYETGAGTMRLLPGAVDGEVV